MHSYSVEVCGSRAEHPLKEHAGWCFGLPAGIKSEHWPLDLTNGYPLVHGFTLMLPEEYRCHGPDIVGLSFFGVAFDTQDVNSEADPEIAKAFTSTTKPSDIDLSFFWDAERRAHPRMFRMKDVLGDDFAIILLNRDEIDGPLCDPPLVDANKYRDRLPRPAWLDSGSAFAGYQNGWFDAFFDNMGCIPRDDLAFNCALRLHVNLDDPNAGKAVCPEYDPLQTGYIHSYFTDGNGERTRHPWSRRKSWSHIGGTIRPGQHVPRLSPFYIEIEEHVGGFNLAGGTLQFDFQDMICNLMK